MNFGQLKQRMGKVDMHFDLRLLPEISSDEIEKSIQKGIQTIAGQYPSLNVSVVRERMNPGFNMSLDDQLVTICRESMDCRRNKAVFSKKATSTEAAQFFQAGYQAVVLGRENLRETVIVRMRVIF